MPEFSEVIIDTDSLVFLAAYKEPLAHMRQKKLKDAIHRIADVVDCYSIRPLVKGVGNFRYDIAADYKANRGDKPNQTEEDILYKERIKELYAWAGENLCEPINNAEADDYCAIYALAALERGETPIVSHIDKDLDQIVGWHHNFKTDKVYYVSPEDGYRKLMEQCITGDHTDNIRGLIRVGPVGANNILAQGPIHEWFNYVQKAWQERHPDDWQERLRICANLVMMRYKVEDLRGFTWEEVLETCTWPADLTKENSDE